MSARPASVVPLLLFGIGTGIRLDRDARSMVKRLRHSDDGHASLHPPSISHVSNLVEIAFFYRNATNNSVEHSGGLSRCSGASHSLGVCAAQGSPCWPDQGVRGGKTGENITYVQQLDFSCRVLVGVTEKCRWLAGCREVTNGHMSTTSFGAEMTSISGRFKLCV